MSRLPLTIAITDYDHVRDFVNGRVEAVGIDPNFLVMTIEETFFRFTRFREWDVSEMAMGKYVGLLAQGETGLTAIPVFPSRVFRLSSIFVRSESGLDKPADLAGCRVGVPEWAQTAAIYTRGALMHHYGVDLADIDWYQAGVAEPGRTEKVNLKLPSGVRLTPMPDKNLNDMLLDGELDAVMSAHAIPAFQAGDPRVRRLLPDYQVEEAEYFRATGIFPIMHVVALRAELFERHPWVAANLFRAFEEAKNRSVARALEATASRFPIPWGSYYAERAVETFGENYWPYGLEPNRHTLEQFLRFAHEQGVCCRPLTPEELFPESVRDLFKL